MRKLHSRQITDILDTFGEGLDYIRKQGSVRSDVTVQLLQEMRDNTRTVIHFIQHHQGSDTQTEKSLLPFYETLMQAASDEDHHQSYIKTLKKQLINVENIAYQELKPDRLEMAFLPYKADMWDCMASVYLAAKADPACDVYCVPIPWYEKNPDGSFAKMRYDGGLFPDSVEITDYQEYDIATRKPDVIVVHNPYDGNNLATSVHPDYYCEKLRGLTGCLVYIPYFVSGDDIPEHFCFLPGTIYAHKTIVQSEQQRNRYISVFRNMCKKLNIHLNESDISDRFVALGSPKFDQVLNTRREDCILPEQWRKQIENADGKRKKVILYNTSLASILQNNEQFLNKLLAVFDLFRNREDVVLWWRPHPLSLSTIESMRPQMAEEYRSIVAGYQAESWDSDAENNGVPKSNFIFDDTPDYGDTEIKKRGNFIYDDTPDLHRAIAWSDAYYGGGSSVVELYKVTEKPILLQNANTGIHSDYVPIFYTHYETLEFIYYTETKFNALFRINKQNLNVECLGEFPDESGNFLFWQITELGGKLYFSPCKAKMVGVYDLSANSFYPGIKIKDAPTEYRLGTYLHKSTDNLYASLNSAITYKQYIYFVPTFYPAIIRLDTISGEVTYYDDFMPLLSSCTNSSENMFTMVTRITEDVFVAPCYCGNAFLRFDMSTNKAQIIKAGEKYFRYHSVIYDGNDIWLTPARFGMPIVRYTDNKVIRIDDYNADDSGVGGIPFIGGFFFNDFIYLLPLSAGHAVKIDVHTNELSIVTDFDDFVMNTDAYRLLHSFSFADGIVAGFQIPCTWLTIDIDACSCSQRVLSYSEAMINILTKRKAEYFQDKISIAYEDEGMYLDDLITFLTGFDNDQRESSGESKNAGTRIYDFIRNKALSR